MKIALIIIAALIILATVSYLITKKVKKQRKRKAYSLFLKKMGYDNIGFS